MPSNRLQHYVPRCYLRHFSVDGDRAATNLLNIGSTRAIKNAPLKGQCSRKYLYGRDLTLEKAFQIPEQRYAAVAARVIRDPTAATAEDLGTLRTLTLLQSFRTFAFLEKLVATANQMDKDVIQYSDGSAIPPDLIEMDIPKAISTALNVFVKEIDVIDDLDCCLLVNTTNKSFVTSDDPAVHTNRLHLQKLKSNGFGLSSSGAMFFLPISPELLFMCFDPYVYRAPDRNGHLISVSNPSDVRDLNQLQYLHARHNIYFERWEDHEKISEELESYLIGRPSVWHHFDYYIAASGTHQGAKSILIDGEQYVRVPEPQSGNRSAMVMAFRHVHIHPTRWPKVLKYKLNPKMVDTGTGRGVVRPNHPTLARHAR